MLKKALIEATYFFAKNALNSDVTLFESCPIDKYYAASIDVFGDENHSIFIYINKNSLKKMAYLFLFEEEPTDEVLRDLIKEIANLIVGKAKVVAGENGLYVDIATPNFICEDTQAIQNDIEINFMFEGEIFSIAAKAKNE